MKRLLLIVSILLVIGLVVAASLGFYFMSLRQSASDTAKSEASFVIPKGQAVSIIANRLQTQGLIKNALVFRLELKRLGLEGKLQAGSFDISPSMPLKEVAQILTTGTNDIWITLPEGWRREEIAEYLATQELPGFDETEFIAQTDTLEGTLFPETYLVPRQITTTALINLLTRTFSSKVEEDLEAEIAASNLSLNEIMVMASLVEREARTYEQMRLVSGILQKRLEIGMLLQVDATLQYVKGYDQAKKTWWPTPLDVDRRRVHLFNTYLNLGLPPRPIANAGFDAFRATVNPSATSDLFYIHAPDGKMHTAETLDEHNQNVQRYLR